MNDEVFSDRVRLEWLHKKGEWLPRLPGDSKTHEQFTTQEMYLNDQILKKVADAFNAIHGKDGAK
jgi:hypothetical protein